MRCSRYLIIALILGASLLFAGCTQATNTPVSQAPAASPGALTGIAGLMLDPADLPPGFTLIESTAKAPRDVSSLAKELGWQEGYSVRYDRPAIDRRGPTQLTQSIAIYTEKNILTVIAMSDSQDRTDSDLTYTNITTPGLGAGSRGFFGNASAQVLVKPTNQNPLASGPGSHDVDVVYTREVAEIMFSKGNTLEVFRMAGPGANATILQGLAEKAYSKIP
jgi:hypothetical protein